MNTPKRPKKKNSKREDPESIDGKRPGQKDSPAAAERTDADTPGKSEAIPSQEATSRQSTPVTNQDEQDKITNAEDSDINVADK